MYLREMKTSLHKHLHTMFIDNIIILNTPELETTQVSINWWNVKQNVVNL